MSASPLAMIARRHALPVDDELEFEHKWFAENVKFGETKQFGKDKVSVTPALAAVMLEFNTANRPLRPSKVAALAMAIEAGRWLHTHQGIAVGKSGKLLDGQHRLHAVIKSGRAIVLNVEFGVPDVAYQVIDTGATRTVADAVAVADLNGDEDAKRVAAAALVLICVEHGLREVPSRTRGSLNGQVVEYLRANDGLPAYVQRGRLIMKGVGGGFVAGLAAALYLIGDRMDDGLCGQFESFCDRLRSGLGIKSENDPVHRLRQRLIKKGGLRGVELAACTIKAWNAKVAGKGVPDVRWRDGEAFPVPNLGK